MPKRIEDTGPTPSTLDTSGAIEAGIGEKPSVFCTNTSPWKLRSIAPLIELVMPAAKTVTNTTIATPIISAAAVTAVRPGLRIAFSRARRPVMPRRRSIGLPATDASGFTSRGENSETANSTSAAPPPVMAAAELDGLDPAEQAAEHQRRRPRRRAGSR